MLIASSIAIPYVRGILALHMLLPTAILSFICCYSTCARHSSALFFATCARHSNASIFATCARHSNASIFATCARHSSASIFATCARHFCALHVDCPPTLLNVRGSLAFQMLPHAHGIAVHQGLLRVRTSIKAEFTCFTLCNIWARFFARIALCHKSIWVNYRDRRHGDRFGTLRK